MKSNILPVQEMERILKSLQMKQEACQMIATEDKSQPVKNYILHSDLIKKATECDVSLSMLRPHEIQRTLTSEEATLLAECYLVTADAIQLLLDIRISNPKAGRKLKECVYLLADAQSLLRSVVDFLGMKVDEDQYALFRMLRIFAIGENDFLPQLSNSKAKVTLAEIKEVQNKIKNARIPIDKQKQIEIKLKRLQGLVSANPENEKHWQLIADVVARLIASGIKPSNKKLREILLPVFDEIPTLDDYPKDFEMVLNEIDSFMTDQPALDKPVLKEVPTQDVLNVRRLLEGRKVVLIGGRERKPSTWQLKQAFGLEDLVWVSTTSLTHVDEFEPYVQMPNVAVVLLAIRFASHSYGEVKEYCDKANVPLVRLPAGYGTNQVARQILEQCGNRLKKSPLSI